MTDYRGGEWNEIDATHGETKTMIGIMTDIPREDICQYLILVTYHNSDGRHGIAIVHPFHDNDSALILMSEAAQAIIQNQQGNSNN